MLADGAEDAELDAEPPIVLQIRVEELVHFGHPLCCSEEAHQREWRVHVVKASGSRKVKFAVLLVKRRTVREQEARNGKSLAASIFPQSVVERRHKCRIHPPAINRS